MDNIEDLLKYKIAYINQEIDELQKEIEYNFRWKLQKIVDLIEEVQCVIEESNITEFNTSKNRRKLMEGKKMYDYLAVLEDRLKNAHWDLTKKY